MARIRSIKPEICMSPVVASLSIEAQLMWQRLWCFCDSEGRMGYHPARIKGEIFPLMDQISVQDCSNLVHELSSNGLIAVYSVGSHRFIQVTNWKEHQKTTGESASKIPPPPAVSEVSETGASFEPTAEENDPLGFGLWDVYVCKDPLSNELNSEPKTSLSNNLSGFDAWYSSYPRKQKKQDAIKAWKQTSKIRPPLNDMLVALDNAKKTKQWQKDDGQYIPLPATYLRGGCWDDDTSIVNNTQPPVSDPPKPKYEKDEWGMFPWQSSRRRLTYDDAIPLLPDCYLDHRRRHVTKGLYEDWWGNEYPIPADGIIPDYMTKPEGADDPAVRAAAKEASKAAMQQWDEYRKLHPDEPLPVPADADDTFERLIGKYLKR